MNDVFFTAGNTFNKWYILNLRRMNLRQESKASLNLASNFLAQIYDRNVPLKSYLMSDKNWIGLEFCTKPKT